MKEILKDYISNAAYECITHRSIAPNSFEICSDDIKGQISKNVIFIHWSDVNKHTAETLTYLTATVLYIAIKGV